MLAQSFRHFAGTRQIARRQRDDEFFATIAADEIEFAQLAANLGRNLLEGRLGIMTAVFEAASTKA